jgi:preprotein translocase subunit SecG
MSFIVGVLTFFLVINCLMLILLVLVQLPKKDAGAGIAFGGGTADALFGAGSGNVLTKITKYATVALLVLSVFLGYLQDKTHTANSSATFEKMVEQKQQQTPVAPAAAPQSATTPAPTTANNLLSTLPATPPSNAPAAKK